MLTKHATSYICPYHPFLMVLFPQEKKKLISVHSISGKLIA